MPVLTQLSDGRWAVDYGPPGPYIVLSRRQLAQLALALHNHDIITLARLHPVLPGT